MKRKITGNDFFGAEIKSTLMLGLWSALRELYNGHSGGFAARFALAPIFSFTDISGGFDGGV